MPLLVALDECNRALTRVEMCARLGLEYPHIQEAILTLILAQCHETDQHIGELEVSNALVQFLPGMAVPDRKSAL